MLKLIAFACTILIACKAQDSIISGYGPVNLDDLHPLTLSWNQVHYLVRDSLLEIDELAKLHDEFYIDLHECFGLENCIKQGNMLGGPPQSGRELGAGAFLAALRRQKIEELSGRHSQITAGLNAIEQKLKIKQEQQRIDQENRSRMTQQGAEQRSSSSYSSTFRQSRIGSSPQSNSGSSWSSTQERTYQVTSRAGGTYTRKEMSSGSASRSRQIFSEYESDYEEGPIPNRG